MSEITIGSKRIYLDTLSMEDRYALFESLYIYNRAKEELYNRYYDNIFLGKTLNPNAYIMNWLQAHFGFRPQAYHITSLISHAQGMVRSQKELQKQYLKDEETREKTRKNKVKSLKRELTILSKSRDTVEAYYKKRADGKKARVSVPPSISAMHDFKRQFNNVATDEEIYLYRVWLNNQIRARKTKIALIEEKRKQAATNLQNHTVSYETVVEDKKEKIEEKSDSSPVDEPSKASAPKIVKVTEVIPNRIIFGGKPFYKSKDTTEISYSEWHTERLDKRFKSMKFNGRFDAPSKNWLVNYSGSGSDMTIKLITGKSVALKNVIFPYRSDDLQKVLNHEKEPNWSVQYALEFHKDLENRDFVIIKASFGLEDNNHYINHDKSSGVIGIDLNLDNISWAELDSEGHRIRGGMVKFSLYGKTSEQTTDILGRVCAIIIKICVDTKKPLVMEDLDLEDKKASLEYGKKRANRGTSSFAYSKMTELLLSRAYRYSINVIKVNPAYTSFIGKVKYLKSMHCPIHMAAAYVIGRRGMGFSEKIPKVFRQLIPDTKIHRHHWAHFAYLYRNSKNIKTKTFRRPLPIYTDLREFKKLAS